MRFRSIKNSHSHLLDQIFILFNYFWSIEFVQLSATIMSFKVCRVVCMQISILTKKSLIRWGIDHSMHSISSFSFTRSILHIFRLFLKRQTRFDQSYNYVSQSSRSIHEVTARSRVILRVKSRVILRVKSSVAELFRLLSISKKLIRLILHAKPSRFTLKCRKSKVENVSQKRFLLTWKKLSIMWTAISWFVECKKWRLTTI